MAVWVGPAPERWKGNSWKEFLHAHWSPLSALGCFRVEVPTLSGLQRHWGNVVLKLDTRRVTIAGTIAEPSGRWVEQVARDLADGFEGVLEGKWYLPHDPRAVCTKRRYLL